MKSTSWDKSAEWYADLLKDKDNTYQGRVILPNLLRLLEIKKGETVLDLACGPGFFTREFEKKGATVIGVDLSSELIEIAKRESPKEITYFVSDAKDIRDIAEKSIDKVVIVLALQNMDDINAVLKECSRVLKKSGKLFIVINHPAFRVPKESSWGWDEEQKTQYRRIDKYLSESKVSIEMHPGDNPQEKTLTFHRPLQSYFKSLSKNGFTVNRLEEWISDKRSEAGPRQKVEDKVRIEIPLFLFIEAVKL